MTESPSESSAQDFRKPQRFASFDGLLEAVTQSYTDAIVITEAAPIAGSGPRIVYVNSAFTRMTGYRPEDICGKTPRVLQGPLTDRVALRRIRHAIERCEPIEVELVNYSLDRVPFYVTLSIAPIFNDHGDVTHFVSVQRDITARAQSAIFERGCREVLESLADGQPLDALLEQVARTAQRAVGFARCTFQRAPVAGAAGGALFIVADGNGQPFGALSMEFMDGRMPREEEQAIAAEAARLAERCIAARASAQRGDGPDSVTGLATSEAIERIAFGRQTANEFAGGVCVLDVDRFHQVNEAYGHRVGDDVIEMIAARLREIVEPGETLGRIVGGGFVLLTSDGGGPGEVERRARAMLGVLDHPFAVGNHRVALHGRVGITHVDGAIKRAGGYVRLAQLAARYAKRTGDEVRVWNESWGEAASSRLEMIADLEGALTRGEFYVEYQPIVEMDSRKTSGVEALVRWNHPRFGPLTAARFIDVAEETGAVVDIGYWVLDEACATGRMWLERGRPLTVSVNVSARQFDDGCFVERVQEALAESGLPPHLLCLELTETTVMRDAERSARMLAELRGLGVVTALDDFGTGYSSLTYLKRFPLDVLKLDLSFIADIGTERSTKRDKAIVKTILAVAEALDLKTVAEGIESEEQWRFLLSNGCASGQGYLFGRPAAIGAI